MRILCLLLSMSAYVLFGQLKDSSAVHALKGHTVTTYKTKASSETSLNIARISVDSSGGLGNFNLTDLLSKVPGVQMLSTGPSISKPVIRGLYGNRVLVLYNGLKFDNQQWQEEHGLGLSDAGISNVDMIKGPLGVLYGSEAMGGTINLLDEDKAAIGKKASDITVRGFSNTMGASLNAGIKWHTGKRWMTLRVASDQHADYFDGEHRRVLNSRSDANLLKASYGFKRKNWVSDNHYTGSFNRFGFIFNDIYDFVSEDARYSRSLSANPAHMVLLNILSSDNKITAKNGDVFSVNAGVQSNRRMENEGGGAISLDIHLLTLQYLLKWQHNLSKKHQLIVSHLSAFENNTNYGARKIVPDANIFESNASAFIESQLSKRLSLENGVGLGVKQIHTFLTSGVNSAGKDIQPFLKQSPYYNFLSGCNYKMNKQWFFKLNIASGVRIPNLAELSSDGLHEGVFTYEIGNQYLKNEQMFSINTSINWQMSKCDVVLTPFYNQFKNYIYLAPVNEQWNGFPVYRYKQEDVQQKGLEAMLNIRLTQLMLVSVSAAGMRSHGLLSGNTPYTPANKISASFQKAFKLKNKYVYFKAEAEHWAAQNRLALAEKGTPAYQLYHCALWGNSVLGKQSIEWKLGVNNISNTYYYDHLSRLKNFGIYNMGRQLSVSVKWKFNRAIN